MQFFGKIFAEHRIVPKPSQTHIHTTWISTLSILLNPALTYLLLQILQTSMNINSVAVSDNRIALIYKKWIFIPIMKY